jgi:hypothetical protein
VRTATVLRLTTDIVRWNPIRSGRIVEDLRRFRDAALDRDRRAFVQLTVRDAMRFVLGSVRPVEGETLARAHLAAAWLARAHDATGQQGLAYGYFPCRPDWGWQPSYPETTGYTIPTLLEYAAATGREEYRARALKMAEWVAQCQMPCGAIYGGTVRPAEQAVPVAFNTGMVLLGFSAAYRETAAPAFLAAARRAADFLAGDIDEEGYFHSHGPFVERNVIKTYISMCAWPLYLAAEDTGTERYADAAYRAADGALRQQLPTGWFQNNCLSMRAEMPLLHTIGYTVQGLLELGIRSGRSQYVDAAMRAVDPLLKQCGRGFLHGRWYPDWQPAAFSSCLTGSAQIAVVCYRLASHTGLERYAKAADRVLNYLKALQPTGSPVREVVGGIGGSFPLSGAYMRFGFPGWATKFYLDALLWQARNASAEPSRSLGIAVTPC